MSEKARLYVGKHYFEIKYYPPYVWLIPFEPSSYRNGKFKTSVRLAKRKVASLGLTIDAIEKQLSLLTGIPEDIWKRYREYSLTEDTSELDESLEQDGYDIDDFENTPNVISALEYLTEDEGLYEISLLYQMLLALEDEKDTASVILDLAQLEIEDPHEVREAFVNKVVAYNALFGFVASDSDTENTVISKIKTLDEQTLIDQVIIPLLLKMGYRGVKSVPHHGPSEFGQDIRLFYNVDALGIRVYHGAQVKIDDIHISSKKMNGNAASVANQLEVALRQPFIDEEDNVKKIVDNVMLITAGKVLDTARDYLYNKFQKRELKIIDGKKLAELIVKYQLANKVLAI